MRFKYGFAPSFLCCSVSGASRTPVIVDTITLRFDSSRAAAVPILRNFIFP